MNSMEEDELFKHWGWEKDLIGRKWVSPLGMKISFDEIMSKYGDDFFGEIMLRGLIMQYGEPVNDQR